MHNPLSIEEIPTWQQNIQCKVTTSGPTRRTNQKVKIQVRYQRINVNRQLKRSTHINKLIRKTTNLSSHHIWQWIQNHPWKNHLAYVETELRSGNVTTNKAPDYGKLNLSIIMIDNSKQQSKVMAWNTKSTHYYQKEQLMTLSHWSKKLNSPTK